MTARKAEMEKHRIGLCDKMKRRLKEMTAVAEDMANNLPPANPAPPDDEDVPPVTPPAAPAANHGKPSSASSFTEMRPPGMPRMIPENDPCLRGSGAIKIKPGSTAAEFRNIVLAAAKKATVPPAEIKREPNSPTSSSEIPDYPSSDRSSDDYSTLMGKQWKRDRRMVHFRIWGAKAMRGAGPVRDKGLSKPPRKQRKTETSATSSIGPQGPQVVCLGWLAPRRHINIKSPKAHLLEMRCIGVSVVCLGSSTTAAHGTSAQAHAHKH